MTSPVLETTVDELVTLQNEKVFANKSAQLPYVGLEHIASGKPRLLGVAESSSSLSVNSVFQKDDILFGKLRPNLRKSLRAPFPGYCSTDILVLRCMPGIMPTFAGHVFQWERVFSAATATAAGTKMPRTSWGDLKGLAVFFPESVAEQSRIAAILDAVDEAIFQTEAVLAKLKQIRTGLLHDLLTHGLDENGKLRESAVHPEQFQDSILGRMPACWDITSVEQAGEVRLGRQRSPAHETGQHIRPYLRVANVFDCFIDYSDVLSMNFNPHEQATYHLCAGDILLNEGQSLELVGRSAIFEGPPDTYCFQNTLVRFRCNDTTIPEYSQAVFKYWLDTGAFTRIAKQTTSVAHLGADRFAKMPFPRPSLFEQRLIADRLAEIAAMQKNESAELCKLANIKAGLMCDLLTGRVRVPADLLDTRT
ncbi:hypothetical protein [uncultured Thiodictyon sp.]|jgi:type I restriction enzyme S subunit|uniref:restriction endonuclease subunit S n=1 Tax=uncultured Thiodictyon sp. TaxID=1846217 RepID=UPI0025D3321F|nr:hypothetical protein [uncultured Thiodictyon sp.]